MRKCCADDMRGNGGGGGGGVLLFPGAANGELTRGEWKRPGTGEFSRDPKGEALLLRGIGIGGGGGGGGVEWRSP
jgi:hypothetical protein